MNKLEVVGKVEQAKKLLEEVIVELDKQNKSINTFWRIRKARSLLYLALKYWGD